MEDTDECYDGKGAIETDARRHVESVYDLASPLGSPKAAAAGRIHRAFKMAQAGAVGVFY